MITNSPNWFFAAKRFPRTDYESSIDEDFVPYHEDNGDGTCSHHFMSFTFRPKWSVKESLYDDIGRSEPIKVRDWKFDFAHTPYCGCDKCEEIRHCNIGSRVHVPAGFEFEFDPVASAKEVSREFTAGQSRD